MKQCVNEITKEQAKTYPFLKLSLSSTSGSEGGGGACSVFASYILHNSLAYGADWSQLSLEEPAPCSPPAAQSEQSLAESAGHLRIQFESPTASFDTSLEDDCGRYIPEGPAASAAAGPAPSSDGNTASLSCLLASCSFYDHMLHVWRWDWAPEEGQQEPEQCWPGWSTSSLFSLWTMTPTDEKQNVCPVIIWAWPPPIPHPHSVFIINSPHWRISYHEKC